MKHELCRQKIVFVRCKKIDIIFIFICIHIIYISFYTWRRQFPVESACVSLFLIFRRIGEYISLDLFYFVNLTAVVHSSRVSCLVNFGISSFRQPHGGHRRTNHTPEILLHIQNSFTPDCSTHKPLNRMSKAGSHFWTQHNRGIV